MAFEHDGMGLVQTLAIVVPDTRALDIPSDAIFIHGLPMLYSIPGFIGWWVDRFITRGDANQRGLGAPRGAVIALPLALLIWGSVILICYWFLG